jgi:tRNA(fMet)-specific endonuclease VapC
MSLYFLDTDILTLFQRDDPNVVMNVNKHPLKEVGITIISVEEQLTGWYSEVRRAKKPDTLAKAYERLAINVQRLAGLKIVSFTEAAILRYEHLKTLKLQVAKMDLRIAAIALENNAVVVTRNLRDFQRVPNLTVEDWSV